MKYVNANTLLPAVLVEELQGYIHTYNKISFTIIYGAARHEYDI